MEFTVFPLWYPPIWTYHSQKPRSEHYDPDRQKKPTSSGLRVRKGYSWPLKETWKSPEVFFFFLPFSLSLTLQSWGNPVVGSQEPLWKPTSVTRTHRAKKATPLLRYCCHSKSTRQDSMASPSCSLSLFPSLSMSYLLDQDTNSITEVSNRIQQSRVTRAPNSDQRTKGEVSEIRKFWREIKDVWV